ncbi:hypothetical protein HA402_005577 [Bradysia odoriphaga]|nr:hypothetical protein HA402_005577 [Bradysia odoriphaga]
MRLLTILSLFHLQLIRAQLLDMKCNYTEASLDYYSKRICNTIDLNVEELDQVLDSVNGEKTELDDVIGLVIENQVFRYIPYFLDVYMPKLTLIYIISSELRLISKYDLEPFPNLRELVLEDNQLQYLEGDVFSLSTKIKHLRLQDNYLFVINGPIFKPLKLLTWMAIALPCMHKDCFSNDCVSETVFEFKLKCEYDSIYPGFQEYFKFWMNTIEECEGDASVLD